MLKKEYVEIVDEKGNPTGEILEKEEAHDKNLFHKEVSLFLINSNNQILLQKRSSNKKIKPSKWGLCGGHVEAHEDISKAMLRELKEEIGVFANAEDIVLFYTVLKNRKINSHVEYQYYMFLDRNEKDFVIQEEELSEVKWVNFVDYKNMIINNDPSITRSNNEENLNMIKKLEEIIRNRNNKETEYL